MRSEIEALLPAVFRRAIEPGEPLDAILEVMAGHAESVRMAIGGVDAVFNPHRCPERFVPYLAGWVDLARCFVEEEGEAAGRDPATLNIATGYGRLRELIAIAAELARWRGTSWGLLRFLETVTGMSGFAVDETPSGGRPFHIRVRAPAASEVHRSLIARIIELEKPAYITFELSFTREQEGAGP